MSGRSAVSLSQGPQLTRAVQSAAHKLAHTHRTTNENKVLHIKNLLFPTTGRNSSRIMFDICLSCPKGNVR